MRAARLIPLDIRLAMVVGAALTALSVSASSFGAAQQTLVAPAADSYVSSAKPRANYGAKSTLKADRSPVVRTYVRFDVPSLPGAVTRASLRLYSPSSSTAGYEIRGVSDNAWTESTITYANAPPPSTTSSAASGSYRSGAWTSVDVTPLVSGAGAVTLAVTTSSTRGIAVASRETGSTSPSLVIETASSDPTPSDTTPPTTPGGLATTAATASSVSVSWGASRDDVSVTGYDMYLDGDPVDSTTATSYTYGGLTCGTGHLLGVEAYDATGNRSTRASLTSSTAPCRSDATPPTAPTGLATTASSASSVSVSWTASTDDVGVTGYYTYLDGKQVDSTAGTSYTFGGLTCGTGHVLTVEAYDAAGNRSTSASLNASTATCPSTGGTNVAYRFAYSNRQSQSSMPQYGFNLIDVATKSEADATPPGTYGQVWLWDYDNTTCNWELDDATISARVSSMANDPKVAGFYFANESDPVKCPNAIQQHRDRNRLIKSLAPNKYTVLAVDSNWREHFDLQVPMWKGVADYLVYNPYICYVGRACDYAWLDHVLAAAQANGNQYFIALQAFSEGNEWRWPTATEERQMLARLKDPSLTLLRGYYTFSWDWNNDPLLNHPDVLKEIQDFNLWASGSAVGDTTPPTAPGALGVTSSGATSIGIGWSASTDDIGVAGYKVFKDGNVVDSVGASTLTYSFDGLSCNTSYVLGVTAYDAAGNVSSTSSATAPTGVCPTGGGGGGGGPDPVVVAAGDLCGSATGCAPTAALIGQIAPTRVLTLGDNAYPDGTASDFASYYDPNWGNYKSITSPAPGNHDYHTANGAGYFGYFGSQAPAPYYSFDLGEWHIVSLNGEVGVSSGSAQETWLKNDLAAHSNVCTLLYWHEPRWSSGSEHGSDISFSTFWQDAFAAGVDVILNGHDHDYERFAPQSPSGALDTAKGIRQFVVGTGGAGLYQFATPLPNSEARNNDTFGVLKLTLHATSYDWEFVPAGGQFTDSGTQACH